MPLSRKQLFLGFCGVLVFLGLLAVPLYRHVKVWRARRLAETALELLADRETIMEAWEKAQAAYNLAPAEYDAVHALARVMTKGDPSLALPLWEEVLKLSNGAAEDRLELVGTALAIKRFPLAGEHLDILKKEAPLHPEYLYLQSQFYLGQNQLDEAIEMASRLLELDDVPGKAHLYFVQLSQLSTQPQIRQAGIDHLWELARRTDGLGISAIKNLARFPGRNSETTPTLIGLLDQHPAATLQEQLLHLELELTLPGANAEQIIFGAEEKLDLQIPEKRLEFARWLNGKRLHEHTLRLFDEKRAMSRKDFFLVWIDAMAVLNRWEEIGRILEQPGIPLETSVMHLFKMRFYRATNQFARADIEWEKALFSAVGEPAKLWSMFNYAQRLNLSLYARSALERLISFPSAMREAYEKLLLLERGLGSTGAILAVVRKMAEVYPADPAVNNDIAYLSLLLEEDVEKSVHIARRLVEDNPRYLSHRVTLALGYYRRGKVRAALQLFGGLKLDEIDIPNRWLPVFAAILEANGLLLQADNMRSKINSEALLPEELNLSKWSL